MLGRKKSEGSLVPSLDVTATVAIDYVAELPESISVPGKAQVRVIAPGEEWTFCEFNGKKGFLPTTLLSVSAETLLQYCARRDIPVAPAPNSESSELSTSSAGSSLKQALPSGLTKVERVEKEAASVIPAHVWQELSDTERHRQQMIYGIIHAEFLYNKNLWALTQVARDFAALNTSHALLSSDEEDCLFKDVDLLYSLSNGIFGKLMRKLNEAENGLIGSVVDVIEGSLHAFEAYVAYCGKDRRVIQQQIFLEYRGLFGHPFQKFLEKLQQQVDLQTLVNKPAEYISIWPFYLKNLLKDTSKRSQQMEYVGLKRLQSIFAGLTAQMQRSSASLAADFKRRVVNYAKVEPHLRGRRLLKESTCSIVAASGMDYGNQAFLFDTCIIFAKTVDSDEKKDDKYRDNRDCMLRALKKIKLSGLRIADVKKSTIVLRTEGDKYYLSFPHSKTAIDWRNLISHKNYRELLDVSDYDSEDMHHAVVPLHQPEFDAHVARVERMRGYIAGLLGPGAPVLAAISAAGPETLKGRAKGPSSRRKESTKPLSAGKGKEEEASYHAYTDSSETTTSSSHGKKAGTSSRLPPTSVGSDGGAAMGGQRKVSAVPEDEEESSSTTSEVVARGNTVVKVQKQPSSDSSEEEEYYEDEDEYEEEEEYYESSSVSQQQTSQRKEAVQVAAPKQLNVTKKSSESVEDSSEYDLSSSTTNEAVERKTSARSGPGPAAMYRTLTGTLENIIKSSTINSRNMSSEGESYEEGEWETEFESTVSEQVRPGPASSTPIARPTAAQFSNSPDESPVRSGNTSGKVTARSGGGAKSSEFGSSEEEEEWEEEEEEEITYTESQ
jgi:hypothetical protein